MRILIVEDHPKIANYLAKGLKENGFIVDTAPDGEEGLYQATTVHYDLIILDVMLPKFDGWFLIKKIREYNLNVLVLFLTARDELQDRVKGLELGADDYLVKPFAFSELLARVRTLLRRHSQHPQDKISIFDLTIDLLKHKVTRSNSTIDLSPKEFMLVTFMAQHCGEVLTRTLIAERVWDIHFSSDTNIIDVAIRRLRKKIDDDYSKKLIHTIRGVGYVFGEK